MRTFALAMLLPVTAFAQVPQITVQAQGHEMNFTMTGAQQSTPEDIELTPEPQVLLFRHVEAGSIEHRFTRQAAIGDGGPHADLDITADSPWKKLPYVKQGDAVRVVLQDPKSWDYTRADAEAALNPSPERLNAAVKKAWGDRDPEAACLTVDDGLCYSYRSENRFRFRGTDGKMYELSLTQPGGC